MAGEKLSVLPTALHGASQIIEGHASALAPPAGSLGVSTELSGAAAATFDDGLNRYSAEFSGRLSSVAAALVSAADFYTAMDDVNSAALGAIVPVRSE
jgi:hypothetical protein